MHAQILALDPMLSGDIDLGIVLIVLLKTVIAFTLLLVSVLFMVWFERKAISDLQNRIGPNRAGPCGLFQTVADGLKFFMKEDSLPDRAEVLVPEGEDGEELARRIESQLGLGATRVPAWTFAATAPPATTTRSTRWWATRPRKSSGPAMLGRERSSCLPGASSAWQVK